MLKVNVVLPSMLLLIVVHSISTHAATSAERATAQSLQNQINQAIANGNSVLTLTPGEYRVAAPGGSGEILNVVNANGLHIHADGVKLIATELTQVFKVYGSSNLTVSGLTIDYDPLPFTQGTIVSKASNNSWFDVQIHDGYDTVYGSTRAILYEPGSQQIKYDQQTRYGFNMSPVGGGLVRVSGYAINDSMAINDLVSLTRPDTVLPHALLVEKSSGILMQDVTVHTSTSFGLFESQGGSNRYENVQVIPGELPAGATQPRLLSTSADAFHSKHTSVGPSIINSRFISQGDDGVAINSDYTLVGSSSGNQVIVGIRYSWQGPVFQVGDRVRGYDRETGSVTEATVTGLVFDNSLNFAAIRDTYLPNLIGSGMFEIGYKVTLDQPISLSAGDLMASPDRNGAGFEIRDTVVENNRARGILVKASDGVIEGNTVDGSSIAGIVVAAEPYNWMESDFSSNLQILNNTVIGTGGRYDNQNDPQAGAISITGPSDWNGPAHSNITVDGNIVQGAYGTNLVVSMAGNVNVINNQFIDTHSIDTTNGTNTGVDPKSVVWIDDANEVVLAGNTVLHQGPNGDKLVRITQNGTGLIGTDTGVRLIHDEPYLVVADYQDDFQASSPAPGWSYLWNEFGNVTFPSNYSPLTSTGGGDYMAETSYPAASPASYVRLGQDNGHPGQGFTQSGIDRYAIAAYTVETDGEYAIRDSFIKTTLQTGGVRIIIHVNSGNVMYDVDHEAGTTASFDLSLGNLLAGDTVYVAFGPDGTDSFDFFNLDFSIGLTSLLEGDLNGDGFVGIADLNIVLGNWNQTVPPSDPAADPSGDSFVGIADLNVVLGNWNTGTPPTNNTNIPEPASLACLSMGVLGLTRCSRQLA